MAAVALAARAFADDVERIDELPVHPPITRPAMPATPTVRVLTPPEMPAAPCRPFCEHAELIAGLDLSAGAIRVFGVLHSLACGIARVRGHRVLPDTMTFHVPALVVAGLAEYDPRHLRRLLPDLEAAGLVVSGAHAAKVGLRSLWDGTIFCVKMKPGVTCPELRREDWKFAWRPAFEADVHGKRGAASFMSGLRSQELSTEEQIKAVAHAAVTGVYADLPPVGLSSADMGLEGVRDVREIVYRLGELPAAHKRHRAAFVGTVADALSRAFDDRHSRRWYAGLIWRAWRGHVEGRADLQVLVGAILRVEDERREWSSLRRPPALLAARLRVA